MWWWWIITEAGAISHEKTILGADGAISKNEEDHRTRWEEKLKWAQPEEKRD